MKLVKATEKDSPRLIEFFQNTPLSGPIEIHYDRNNDFFAPYQTQSDDFTTYLLEDDDGQIQASASLVFRNGWINNQQEVIGLATDLRVSSSRKAILHWSNHFLPVLEEERKRRNCRYIFSVVAEHHTQAQNAFIRPRSARRNLPRYFLFRRFEVVSLHGLLPFAPKPLATITTRHAHASDWPQISQYIVEQSEKKPLHYFQDEQQLSQIIHRWPGVKLEDFIVALDSSGKLIGTVLPWKENPVQKLKIKSLQQKAKTFQELLQGLAIFGMAHRLAKPGEHLNFKHLMYLHADNPDIFYSLLYQAFKEASKQEFLIYPHFQGNLLSKTPRSFIAGKLKYGMYCILSPNEELPEFLKPGSLPQPPSFELPQL